MKNVTAQSVGDSGDGVGCEKDGMKVKGMKGGLPFLVFCTATEQRRKARSLAQLLLSTLP